MKNIAEIAIPINLNKTFSYAIPENLLGIVAIGSIVLVPFSGRKLTGYVVNISDTAQVADVKEIIQTLSDTPLFSATDLDFFKWLSAYYIAPLAEVIRTALPAGINKQSKKYYKITKDGEEHILSKTSAGEAEPADNNFAILKFIMETDTVSIIALKRKFNVRNIFPLLKRLEDKGLICSNELTSTASDKVLKKSYVKEAILNEETKGAFSDYILALPKNAKNKAGICQLIFDNKSISFIELAQKFKNPKAVIDDLTKLNYIKILEKEKEVSYANNKLQPFHKDIVFTVEQNNAIKEITDALDSGAYHPFLLHGITGSGKTEVYIQAAMRAIESRKGVIILTPEIALTPNLIRRFTQHFSEVVVMHSSISPQEKYQYYLKVLKGDVKVVIGARSAIFAPFKNLGLIIVDEEHEAAYKQDDGFKYNARDVALVKARANNCVIVLGSATPSVESYYNSANGKYKLLRLANRIQKSLPPEISVVDMKEEREKEPKKEIIISDVLMTKIKENLERKKQTVLFLNRRGHSTFIVCANCGGTQVCPNCSISLTYHKTKRANVLLCHYCGFKKEPPSFCPNCNGTWLKAVGYGTQRICEIVKDAFPDANLFRMDSDTMTQKDSYIDFYKDMNSGKIDIVIGTQMIAKGHDFSGVTLVGILNADSGLTLPDFRAEEKAFSLITQVSGRAGRGDENSAVVIQTLNPESDCITYALKGEVEKFYSREIALREELQFPPFSRLVNIKIISKKEDLGVKAYTKLAEIAANILKDKKHKGISIMGPVSCPIYKIKNNFRWQMLAKSSDSKKLHLFVSELQEKLAPEVSKNHVKISVDVDPINML